MGVLVRKVSCPGGTHDDTTPSCGVYDDGSMFCFSCSSYFPSVGEVEVREVKKKPEDLRERFNYINSLPFIHHRGLDFRYDSIGYFVCWPLQDYYKLRLWAPKPGESKYLGAKGHKKPWFSLKVNKKVDTCVITEGEINAMSMHTLRLNVDILSPGGASNFFDGEMKLRCTVFSNYSKILVLVDKDKAGLEAAIRFHTLVKPYCPDIRIKLLEKGQDCNEILNKKDGKEELKQLILGM